MLWETQNDKKIDELYEKVDAHREKLEQLTEKISLLLGAKPESLSSEEKARLADLEVKMAKLWGLLLETTPLGKDKVSKFGRKFGGKL